MKRWSVVVAVFVSVSIVGLTIFILATGKTPRDLPSAEQAWRQAEIENYRLDIVVDGCMACGPLRYSVVVANGEKTTETDPPAPTVEELFRLIEGYEPDGATVTYNDLRVPIEMELDSPHVEDDQAHYTVTFTET